MISVIIPCYNEERYIGPFLESLLHQTIGIDNLEVIIVDGMSNDGTREILKNYLNNQNILLIDNTERTVPFALNKGIQYSHGDYIALMGVHCKYPENYFEKLYSAIRQYDVDCVGGASITRPARNTSLCNAIAIAGSNIFGVGNSRFRIGVTDIQEVDTVAFGLYRREVFDKYGYFDTELARDQDDEYNARLRKNNRKILLVPDVRIEYYARDSRKTQFQMNYQYGLFKPLVAKKIGKPISIRQIVPFLFVCWLLIGSIVSIFSKAMMIINVGIALVYIGISLVISLKEALHVHDMKLIFILPQIFFIQHFAYGCGYLSGIVYFLLLGREKVDLKVSR